MWVRLAVAFMDDADVRYGGYGGMRFEVGFEGGFVGVAGFVAADGDAEF